MLVCISSPNAGSGWKIIVPGPYVFPPMTNMWTVGPHSREVGVMGMAGQPHKPVLKGIYIASKLYLFSRIRSRCRDRRPGRKPAASGCPGIEVVDGIADVLAEFVINRAAADRAVAL